MPIYEYICRKCEARFDHLAKSMSDNGAKVKCPKCNSTRTERAMSVFAVGSGEKSSAPASPCDRCSAEGGCPMRE